MSFCLRHKESLQPDKSFCFTMNSVSFFVKNSRHTLIAVTVAIKNRDHVTDVVFCNIIADTRQQRFAPWTQISWSSSSELPSRTAVCFSPVSGESPRQLTPQLKYSQTRNWLIRHVPNSPPSTGVTYLAASHEECSNLDFSRSVQSENLKSLFQYTLDY